MHSKAAYTTRIQGSDAEISPFLRRGNLHDLVLPSRTSFLHSSLTPRSSFLYFVVALRAHSTPGPRYPLQQSAHMPLRFSLLSLTWCNFIERGGVILARASVLVVRVRAICSRQLALILTSKFSIQSGSRQVVCATRLLVTARGTACHPHASTSFWYFFPRSSKTQMPDVVNIRHCLALSRNPGGIKNSADSN
jgi:hypothetical protein